MAQIRDRIGNRMMVPQNWIDRYQDSESVNRVQIYEDRGSGCSEENSYFVREAYQGENKIEMELLVSGDVKILRIDPAFTSCMVRIEELTFNGEAVPFDNRKLLLTNCFIAKPATIVFPTEDPNINLVLSELNRQPENILYVRMEIVRLPLAMAQDMANAVKKLI